MTDPVIGPMKSSDGERRSRNRGTRALLAAASAVVVIAGLKAASPVILPLLLALFLTFVSLPGLRWLMRRGLRPAFAVLVTVLFVFALLSGLGLLIRGTIAEFTQVAPGYTEVLVAKVRSWQEALELRNIRVSDWFSLEPVDAQFLVDMAGGILGGTVRGLASAVSYILLVVLTMIFMLFEAVNFPAKLEAALGKGSQLHHYIDAIGPQIVRYLEMKTLISVFTGVLLGTWTAVLGVPFALLWGLLAFLLNFIPNIGSILAAISPILVALVIHGAGRAWIVALGYIVVNIGVGNLLEPRLMGQRVGLSTLVVFLSLILWGWVWGAPGMLLSVPLTMVVKIMLENSRDLKWVAVLLGRKPPREVVS